MKKKKREILGVWEWRQHLLSNNSSTGGNTFQIMTFPIIII